MVLTLEHMLATLALRSSDLYNLTMRCIPYPLVLFESLVSKIGKVFIWLSEAVLLFSTLLPSRFKSFCGITATSFQSAVGWQRCLPQSESD